MEIKLSKNFNISECQYSEYARKNTIDNVLPAAYYKNAIALANNVLEPIRKQFGAFSPQSWYRCPEVNKAVGGSQTSDHMLGCAADIVIAGVSNKDLAEWCVKNLMFKQVILRPNLVHISHLEGDNRGQVLHKTKDGYGIGL